MVLYIEIVCTELASFLVHNCFKVHLNVFKSKKLIKLAMEIDTVNSVLK
jgi:hypothetical protein